MNELKERKERVSQGDMPKFSLGECIVLAKALRDNFASKGASPINLAAAIQRSPSSSTWRELTGAAIAYGITEGGYNATEIKLTPLGNRIVNPTEEGDDSAATLESALRPSIPKAFYEKYDGQKLPKEEIGKNVLRELGVTKDRVDEAWKTVIENAKFLGILTDVSGSQYVQLSASKAQALIRRDEGDRQTQTQTPLPQPFSKTGALPTSVEGSYQDNGIGWSLTVKSQKPLNSETKRKLIEVAELLDQVNSTM